MQLGPKLLQNLHQNRMWGQAKLRRKEVFEDHNFVSSGLQNRLCVRGPAIALQEILYTLLHRHDACLFHCREPKIECYPGGSSHSSNLRLT
jgi:hypothetical protein